MDMPPVPWTIEYFIFQVSLERKSVHKSFARYQISSELAPFVYVNDQYDTQISFMLPMNIKE